MPSPYSKVIHNTDMAKNQYPQQDVKIKPLLQRWAENLFLNLFLQIICGPLLQSGETLKYSNLDLQKERKSKLSKLRIALTGQCLLICFNHKIPKNKLAHDVQSSKYLRTRFWGYKVSKKRSHNLKFPSNKIFNSRMKVLNGKSFQLKHFTITKFLITRQMSGVFGRKFLFRTEEAGLFLRSSQ